MKKESEIIAATIEFVKNELKEAEAGHNWFHVDNVYKNANHIAQHHSCDKLVVSLGALLHDIADSKFHDGDESIGPKKAREFLETLEVDPAVIDQVVYIIENISFKGGFLHAEMNEELAVVQDADRLEAIGAIGIARTFHYGGFKNRQIYNPDIAPVLYQDKESYKKSEAPTINHFYEKLLLLKDKMNTEKGRELAEGRHAFMVTFLSQFYAEWDGIA